MKIKVRTKRPNAFIYAILYILIFPLIKLFFRLKVDRKNYKPPKGPFIVISNHMSYIDFLVVMLSFYPHRLNAVAAQKFFLYSPLHWMMPLMGCIPKNLFDPDARSIMRIKDVLNRGDNILLFPEGRCESDGLYTGMHKSTGKLIKKLGLPVMSGFIEGAYNCMPFWRDKFRLGNIRFTMANLFSEEQLQALSVEEINDAIDACLSGRDIPPPKKPFRTFKTKRLAEGLQNIIYFCPKCKREFTLETSGNRIRCIECGNSAVINREGMLIPDEDSIIPQTIAAWYKDQAIYEAAKLNVDMDPVLFNVTVRLPSEKPGGGMVSKGSGIMSLDPSGWHYKGELSGEHAELFFPIDTVPAIPYDPKDDFQIYAHGKFYMFTPDDAQKCVKYAVIGECAYWKFASQIQMTPGNMTDFMVNGNEG